MSVRRSLVWSLCGQSLSVIAMVVAMVVLARTLTPREMGIYAVGLATTGILQIVAAFGLGHFVTREIELTDPTLSSVFTVNALLALLLAVVTYLASFAGAALFTEAGVANVLKLLAIVPLIGIFEFLPAALLQREMRFKPVSIVLMLRAIGSTTVTIVSVLLGASYLSAAYGAIAYALIGAVGMNLALPGHLMMRPGLHDWRRIVPFGLRVMSIGGVSVLSMRMTELVMGRVMGLAALGIFTRASTLYTAIYTNIFGIAARVLFAKLADDNRATGDIRATYLHGIDVTLAIMWPFLLTVATLAGPIIQHAFGSRWLAAAPVLTILMIAQVIAMLFAMSYELFTLRDELARQTRYEGFRSMLGLVLVSAGCLISLEAAAIGRAIETAVAAALYLPHIWRLTGVSPAEFGRVIGRNLLIAVGTLIPMVAIMSISGWRADVPLALLAQIALLTLLAWIVALRIVRHPLLLEIGHALRVVRGRLRLQRGNA